MEENRRKKKNKKKKNNSSTNTSDVTVNQVDGRDVVDDPVSAFNGDGDHNVLHDSNEAEDEKLRWTQKEAEFESTIQQLRTEISSHVRNEGNFDDIIKRMQTEIDSHVHKQAEFEDKMRQCNNENDAYREKVSTLEQKVYQLSDEKAIISSNLASLEGHCRKLGDDNKARISQENSDKEIIARMKIDVTRLQMQVVELEDSKMSLLKNNQQLVKTVGDLEKSRNDLLFDKQQLVDNITALETQLRIIEANYAATAPDKVEKEELISQVDAAGALIDKLIMENAELVEKVSELCIKLNQRILPNDLQKETETTRARDTMFVTEQINHPFGQQLDNTSMNSADPLQLPSESDSADIVQISLDDERVSNVERNGSQAKEKDEGDVPISDAPLIGAPYRFVSFVAKYVSGADLVT